MDLDAARRPVIQEPLEQQQQRFVQTIVMISKEILRASVKGFWGYLPFYKPAGICCNKIRESVKADIYHQFSRSEVGIGVLPIDYARSLEPFADGLVTLILGANTVDRRNFSFAEYHYKFTVEFGVQREFHSVDGQIVARRSVDHLSADEIRLALKDFVGIIEQPRSSFYFVEENINHEPKSLHDYYHLMDFRGNQEEKPVKVQKYPWAAPNRVVTVYEMRLRDFVSPLAEFEVKCQGCFSSRRFCVELSKKLDTFGSLVKLTRLQEGPITINDLRLFHIHDLNLEYYLDRFGAFRPDYARFDREVKSMRKPAKERAKKRIDVDNVPLEKRVDCCYDNLDGTR